MTIRIGTRESALARWQAEQVQTCLLQMGYKAKLVLIKSEGDMNLHIPLYEIGIEGIFTRALDSALLQKKIDLAVHSLKDVPTALLTGITLAAVLKRGSAFDLLVYKGGAGFLESLGCINGRWKETERIGFARIATCSLRRKAQWLNRFPSHEIQSLRGNVNNRLEKLQAENWDGAIFAKAGLERIGLTPENSILLDWMLPAPAQGAIAVVCREEDSRFLELCQSFNDSETEYCVSQERAFLRGFREGCAAPVGALATIKNGRMYFKGNLLSPDGKEMAEVDMEAPLEEARELGANAALQLLKEGWNSTRDKSNL